jgi:F0F1-type ATP synthase assembly protein I
MQRLEGRLDSRTRDWDPSTQPKRPESSLGQLFSDVSSDVTRLFRQEVELAKLEARDEVKRLATGAAMVGAAGFAGLLTLIMVSFAAAWLLDRAMNTALAFLLVGVVWAVIAGALAMVGRKQMKSVATPLPNTTQTIKEDVQWARTLKN